MFKQYQNKKQVTQQSSRILNFDFAIRMLNPIGMLCVHERLMVFTLTLSRYFTSQLFIQVLVFQDHLENEGR
jgi:hypothetical protein